MNARFVILVLVISFLSQILAITEQQVGIGVDGLRCDSCGMECSTVCGSRQFRTCCYNYIKKRGDPALAPSFSISNQNQGSTGSQRSSGGNQKPLYKVTSDGDGVDRPLMSSQSPSRFQGGSLKHYIRRSRPSGLRSILDGFINSDIPLNLDYPSTDDGAWYPYLTRFEDDDPARANGGRFRLMI